MPDSLREKAGLPLFGVNPCFKTLPKRKRPDAFCLALDFFHPFFLSTLAKHPFGTDAAVNRWLRHGDNTNKLELYHLSRLPSSNRFIISFIRFVRVSSRLALSIHLMKFFL